MKKILLHIVLSLTLFSISATTSFAADPIFVDSQCTSVGQCVGNFQCEVSGYDTNAAGEKVPIVSRSKEPNCNSSSIGGITPPGSIKSINDRVKFSGGGNAGESIGIILFISNLLKVFAAVAGLWAMFNLIMGGYTFITSMSDAGAMAKVQNSITMTVIGLAIIAAAYIIAAVIGALMFGDPNFILQPKLEGALQGTTPVN